MNPRCTRTAWLLLGLLFGHMATSKAAVLWSDATSRPVNDTSISLTPSVTRGDTASDTLYFRFRVDPTSDFNNESYFAAFQLYQSGNERLGVGNAFANHAYSVFNTASGTLDLNSANPESGQTYQLVRNADFTTIVFKIQFNNGANDNVTVWLNPTDGSEASQSGSRTTTFLANATFDDILLREGNFPNGDGWTFDNLAIGENFNDLVPVPEPVNVALGVFGSVLAFIAIWRRTRRSARPLA
jgi:hypothetical protein